MSFPEFDDVEDAGKYHLGGFYPATIGEILDNGKYKILHKLGFGGSSTTWLAQSQTTTGLVTVKILSASYSPQLISSLPDLTFPDQLRRYAQSTQDLSIQNI